jgi:hypothetical protein
VTEHVLFYLEDRAHRRRDRWHTKEVAVLPEPFELGEPTIVSRYARCGIESRARFIRTDVLVSVNGCFETPSAVARDYLMLKYRYGPKWTSAQRDVVKAEITGTPLYVVPTKFEDGAYIDIKAAYWSVMVRCGWDVNYYPGHWLAFEDPPLDFPWDYDKRARNSLVSVGRATQITMWRPESGFKLETRPNPRPNSQLFCLIMDLLNAIACDAIAEGAVYVFTDGYIAPDMDTARRIIGRIHEWGFDCRIQGQGRGEVTNLGSYRVGHKHSKKISDAGQHNSVKRLPYYSWLKDRMQFGTDQAPWHDRIVGKQSYHDQYEPG